jgi:hypothetical protein
MSGETTFAKHRIEKTRRIDSSAHVQYFITSGAIRYLKDPSHKVFGRLGARCRSRFLSCSTPIGQDEREEDRHFGEFHTLDFHTTML